MDIKMIALDLDGTLLRSNETISARNREALSRAINRGVHVVIASGRPHCALPSQLLSIPGIEYAITSNGSSIFDLRNNRRICGIDMRAETIDTLLPVIEEADFPCEAAIDGECYTPAAYYANPTAFSLPARMFHYVRSTRRPVTDIPALVRENRSRIEGLFFIIPDQEQKARVYEQIRRAPSLYITSSTYYYLEMANSLVSKASAIDSLARRLGFSSQQVISFGDSTNDLEMIQSCGTGVAMGNASDDLKAAADLIAPSNNEDGVACVIEKLIL